MTQTKQATGHLKPEELNALIDGELSPVDMKNVQNHLDVCHTCALHVLSAIQLKAATARARERFTPPAGTVSRLAAQLGAGSPKSNQRATRPRALSFNLIGAWSSAAAAVLVAILFFVSQRVHQANVQTAELVDQHLSMLASGATAEVVSSDRHTVKPWFQGRLPFSFNLPEPEALPSDTTLRGADLVYAGGQPTALLIFNIKKHEVSVFVTQRSSGFDIAPRSTRSGFAVRSVTAAELRLTAVSDVEPAALDTLLAVLSQVQ